MFAITRSNSPATLVMVTNSQRPVTPAPCHHVSETGTARDDISTFCIRPVPWPETWTPILFLSTDHSNEARIAVPPTEHGTTGITRCQVASRFDFKSPVGVTIGVERR